MSAKRTCNDFWPPLPWLLVLQAGVWDLLKAAYGAQRGGSSSRHVLLPLLQSLLPNNQSRQACMVMMKQKQVERVFLQLHCMTGLLLLQELTSGGLILCCCCSSAGLARSSTGRHR